MVISNRRQIIISCRQITAVYLSLITYYNFLNMQLPRTKRQREILDYVASFIESRGYKPSYQQIARYFRIKSKSAIAKHIAALESQGLLSRYSEQGNFNLQIHSKNSVSEAVCEIKWIEIPFKDALPEEFEDQPIYVPKLLLGNITPEQIRAFLVRNNSMNVEHICEGDIALIEKRTYARDGDIVLALVKKQQIELKKYFRKGANVELRTSDLNDAEIELAADQIEILGILRGLLRPSS